MRQIPNSGAMDSAAGGSGPGALVLPWISAAEPDQILRYSADLAQRASRLIELVERLEAGQHRLRRAWSSGSASDGAMTKLTASIGSLQRIHEQIRGGVSELESAAALIRLLQSAYRSVVSSVNPVVAALLSSPHTRPAATSLAVSTTGSLQAYLGAIRGALEAIGGSNLLRVITALADIARQVEGLLAHDPGGAAAAPGSTAAGSAAPAAWAGPGEAAPLGPAGRPGWTALPGGGSVVTLPDGRMVISLPGTAPAARGGETWIAVDPAGTRATAAGADRCA